MDGLLLDRHEDPLTTVVSEDDYWTTTNTEEAHPGVLTPLGWTVAGPAIERSTRGALHAVGVLSAEEAEAPVRPGDRAFAVFGGRFAARLAFFVDVGNRLPGTTGPALVDQIFGFVPPGATADPVRGRYLAIARRMPIAFATAPRRTRRLRAETAQWWNRERVRTPALGLDAARAQFAAADQRFNALGVADGLLLLAAIQPIYAQLDVLAAAAGVPSAPLMSGHGSHEETQLVADIWAASRGRLSEADLLERYGYHGPRTGELSSLSWRDDPAPLIRAVEQYRSMPDEADPVLADFRRQEKRIEAERALIANTPLHRRPVAMGILKAATRYLPLRGKVGRTQALDVMRAAARRIGELQSLDGALDDAEDAFMLTRAELLDPAARIDREVLSVRRASWDRYRGQTLPRVWQGKPEPVEAVAEPWVHDSPQVAGIGAAPGIVEARARVVTDPASVELEPGEVLVAYTTDPSWASVMFLASALVVDVGGLLSHAAVVARELGLPCVMGTGSGTHDIATGDLVRVDGVAGTVDVLARTEPAAG